MGRPKGDLITFRPAEGRWFVLGRDRHVMLWARIVMENELGRMLNSDEIVHHIDGDRTNDHPSNLVVMTRGEHIGLHKTRYTKGFLLSHLRKMRDSGVKVTAVAINKYPGPHESTYQAVFGSINRAKQLAGIEV